MAPVECANLWLRLVLFVEVGIKHFVVVETSRALVKKAGTHTRRNTAANKADTHGAPTKSEPPSFV